MKRFFPILLMACMVSLTSCDKGIIYSRFVSISSGEWNVDSVARFQYTVTDTETDYRMLVYVRHTERYPYQNMWLFIGDGIRTDTIEFYLADDRGQWLGDKNHGFIEMPVLFEQAKQFADTGTYTMTIQHGMRDSVLRGVMDIGLEIQRNGQK